MQTDGCERRDGERPALPAVLTLLDAVAIVVGSIIGSGVFLKASVVARELGSFGPIVLVWAGIGLVTLCGSLALAEAVLASLLIEKWRESLAGTLLIAVGGVYYAWQARRRP